MTRAPVRRSFEALRQEVVAANRALVTEGLVRMQSGNVSGIHRPTGLVIIKPSGVESARLPPEELCVVRLDGATPPAEDVPDGWQSTLRPSIDTIHHLVLYRALAAVGGVVHTHSNYATAWAALGRAIPCALTAMADEFGGEIPCARYADPDGDELGRALLAARGHGPVVLAARHGLFAFDATPTGAIKAAVMAEDVAKTLWLARSLGSLQPFDDEQVARWWTRYHTTYGQPAAGSSEELAEPAEAGSSAGEQATGRS